jgi:hypothetical protein
MSVARDIVESLYSNNWTQIEQAFQKYHPSLEMQILKEFEIKDEGFVPANLTINFPTMIFVQFNILDEVVIQGTADIDSIERRIIKIQYSYGGTQWQISSQTKNDIERVLSYLKGDCWDCFGSDTFESIDISKPGNDTYIWYQEETRNIHYDFFDENEEDYDSYQYSNNLKNDFFRISMNDIVLRINDVSIVAFLLFLGMKNSVDIKTIEPYKLERLDGETLTVHQEWGTQLFPETKPSDWRYA